MQTAHVAVLSGHPTDAELAAVTAALDRHRRAAASRTSPRSRWVRAARLEASGHPPIDTPMRLTRFTRLTR